MAYMGAMNCTFWAYNRRTSKTIISTELVQMFVAELDLLLEILEVFLFKDCWLSFLHCLGFLYLNRLFFFKILSFDVVK